ncbi:MAG: glutamate racemase [Elusimicrobia bacterium]|nr:MAG: glutamate racemase [Elusimicrobiota bacterium]
MKRGIGVFDSGVGGLTVFKALRKELPHEKLIYFGDTARVPYGTKTKESVTRFSLEIAKFLEKRGIKLLVVACNTASSLALNVLKRNLDIPVVGVIRPAVRAAAAATQTGTIGVIGTEATVASGAYQKALAAIASCDRIIARPCPLFVPLVEEGWWEGAVAKAVAHEYLAPLKRSKMDALILGCTHYPMLAPLLRSVLGKKIRLIDSGSETARDVRAALEADGRLKRSGRGSETFFVTDGAERVKRLARRFLGRRTSRVSVVRLP